MTLDAGPTLIGRMPTWEWVVLPNYRVAKRCDMGWHSWIQLGEAEMYAFRCSRCGEVRDVRIERELVK